MNALKAYVETWDFKLRPVHCTNCRNAHVSGRPDDPMMTCRLGHGKPIRLLIALNPVAPTSFRAAILCPDFESMEE